LITTTTNISIALALGLGLRHGLDADHLAAIDGLTRWNANAQRPFARYCGALFSAGHGAIILTAAVVLAMLARQWTPPSWLSATGALVSATTLLLLSGANLHSVFGKGPNHEVPSAALRARAFLRVLRAQTPWKVALVGAFFALSFDAFGLAAFFAAAASPAGGIFDAAMLALVFAAGMIAVDTANGLWVARLLRRSDSASRHASRVMTLTISAVGILVGACVILSLLFEPIDAWLTVHEYTVSALVIGAILAGYIGALAVARTAGARAASGSPG
jgi:high-affinity nickel-transport protein